MRRGFFLSDMPDAFISRIQAFDPVNALRSPPTLCFRKIFRNLYLKNTLLCLEFGVHYSFTSPERSVFTSMFIGYCLLLTLILVFKFLTK
jgi:hypothetical protein